jgi:hypothetical protein
LSDIPKLALALFALGLLLLTPRAAAACSCGAASVRPCAAYWDARAVFTGAVTEVTESGVRHGGSESTRPFYYRLVRFKVEDSLRGAQGATVEVLTGRGGTDCGYGFVAGRRYLVYAQEGQDGRLYASVCTATKPLEEADGDLSFIRALGGAPPLAAIYGNVEYSGRDFKDSSFRAEPAAELQVLVEGGGVRREALTDARGNFAFEGLPPGSYSVRPVYPQHARGYVDTTPFELRAQQCKELGYLPWWDGRIGGRVLDERGEPVPGLRVYIISPELDLSERSNLMHNMWMTTKDDGSFELTNVPRGRYHLVVNLTGDSDDNVFGYPRTFHPGVEDRARATVIELGGGQWLAGQDFRLTRPRPKAK